MFDLNSLAKLIKTGWDNFISTDINLVNFGSTGLALGAGLFILTVLLLKLLAGKNKFTRLGSGYSIPKSGQQSWLVKILFLVPKSVFSLAGMFILFSIADPYLPRTKTETTNDSRQRIDMFDVSISKGWEYERTGKCAGQIGREYFLDFLKRREGQNDSKSLWLFASEPYKVTEFMTDDELYLMEAEDAPYIKTDPVSAFLPENHEKGALLDIIAPRDRIEFRENEGGTDMAKAIDAALAYYQTSGNKTLRSKALLIETDAAADAYPEKQLQELKKGNIKVYFLYMKPNKIGENQGNRGRKLLNAEKLRDQVQQYGGKFYDIKDRKSLENAYRDIDRLEKTSGTTVTRVFKIFIYQRPLFIAVLLMMLAMAMGISLLIFEEIP